MFERLIRTRRLDSAALFLSVLCLLHCAAGLWLIAGLASAGGALLNPAIHEVGLVVAAIIAALALGQGLRRHGSLTPMIVGVAGIAVMGVALTLDHGREIGFTILGVSLLALAHILNFRAHPRG